uniref:Neuroepithelial cell transforming gene 1 n=1 Tax=Mus musculus TaxID=10090 RepID=A0A1Y7VKV6_MOUSE
MVAHDEIGGLLPIKRTIRVLDVNNQPFREQEEPGAAWPEGCRKL